MSQIQLVYGSLTTAIAVLLVFRFTAYEPSPVVDYANSSRTDCVPAFRCWNLQDARLL